MAESGNSYNDLLSRVQKKADKENKALTQESEIPWSDPVSPMIDVVNSYWKQRFKQELVEIKDTHKLRKKFSLRMFRLTCCWLFVIVCFLIASGLHKIDDFDLPSSVLIALITSTTAAVIGLFVRGNKWLEPVSKEKNSQ